jgi:hypothetical protein
MYRRGVNLVASSTYGDNSSSNNTGDEGLILGAQPVQVVEAPKYDTRGNFMYWYYGDDSATFKIGVTAADPPVSNEIFVQTSAAFTGVTSADNYYIRVGGENMVGFFNLTSFGVDYRYFINDSWTDWVVIYHAGNSVSNNFDFDINDFQSNTLYEYRAFVNSGSNNYMGETLQFTTEQLQIVPSVETRIGDSDVSSINNTGGLNIIGREMIEYYGMQYKCTGDVSNGYSAQQPSFMSMASPITISDDHNKNVFMIPRGGGNDSVTCMMCCGGVDTITEMSAGDCYGLTLGWNVGSPISSIFKSHSVNVICNGTSMYSCAINTKSAITCSGTFDPFIVKHGDDIGVSVFSSAETTKELPSTTRVYLSNVSAGIGKFNIVDDNDGRLNYIQSKTTSVCI